jgi:hypothetical protein
MPDCLAQCPVERLAWLVVHAATTREFSTRLTVAPGYGQYADARLLKMHLYRPVGPFRRWLRKVPGWRAPGWRPVVHYARYARLLAGGKCPVAFQWPARLMQAASGRVGRPVALCSARLGASPGWCVCSGHLKGFNMIPRPVGARARLLQIFRRPVTQIHFFRPVGPLRGCFRKAPGCRAPGCRSVAHHARYARLLAAGWHPIAFQWPAYTYET